MRMFDLKLSDEVRILPYEPPERLMTRMPRELMGTACSGPIIDEEFKEANDVKKDKDKVRLDLVIPEFIEEVGEVLTFGVSKYPANSWQKIPDAVDRYYAAAMRHLMAWRKGEKKDSESELSHLAHAATNLMFLAHFEKENV